jgi:V8-like Glu-specific endopeptidase
MDWDQPDSQVNSEDAALEIISSTMVKVFPHDCVGVLYSKHEDGFVVGTGFLIASDLVLTVARSICSRKRGLEYANVVFYPGVSGSPSPKNAHKVVDYRFPK